MREYLAAKNMSFFSNLKRRKHREFQERYNLKGRRRRSLECVALSSYMESLKTFNAKTMLII